MPRRRTHSSLIDAAQRFASGEQLQVRQDSFSRDGLYQVKAGSVVLFEYYEPDGNHDWARVMARLGGRDHYVTLPSLNLWRPAR